MERARRSARLTEIMPENRNLDELHPPLRIGTQLRPPLIILCGAPGSGKTTIARTLSEKLRGSVHIQTDTIRGMIARPNYGGLESAFVYDSCVRVAKEALRRGRPAILDGTFARSAHRARALSTLRGLYGRCVLVHVVCGMNTAESRNASRRDVVPRERLRGIYASFEEPLDAVKIDTDVRSAEESAAVILAAVTSERKEGEHSAR
jgi:predicted kinase